MTDQVQFQSQVDPQALQILFDADPENLSDKDIDQMCAYLRSQRANFELEEQAKSMKEKKPKVKAVAITKDQANQLSLEDLGL